MAPERFAQLVERAAPSRRDFLRSISLAAYVAPLVASFSLEGLGVRPAEAGIGLPAVCGNVTTASNLAARLVITKSGPTGTVFPGTTVSYTIEVANCGLAAASNVVASDPTPAGTTFVATSQLSGPTATLVSAPAVGGTGTVQWQIPMLFFGNTASFQVQVKVDT